MLVGSFVLILDNLVLGVLVVLVVTLIVLLVLPVV